MTDVPGADAELAAIHAEFAVPVTYTGAGLAGESVDAVVSDVAADVFQGPGDTLRQISFEVLFGSLPGTPDKGDTITDADDTVWVVDDVTRRGDVGAWVLVVVEQ